MKCIKCLEKNINKANYCKSCGYHFSEKEQNIAKRKTLVGKIEFLEELYDKCRLKFITDHIIFKVLSILAVLGIGVFTVLNNGNSLKLIESENYKIQYNTESDEYYLITSKYEVPLEIFVPSKSNSITVKEFDATDKEVSNKTYDLEDGIILETNIDNSYYLLETDYGKNKSEHLKIFVYLERTGK